MTLPSRHKIRNSDPGDLRPSTLSDIEYLRVSGQEQFGFFITHSLFGDGKVNLHRLTRRGLISHGRANTVKAWAVDSSSRFTRKINVFYGGDCSKAHNFVVCNYCSTNEVSMRSCSWNVTDSNTPIIDMINRGQILHVYDRPNTCPMILYGRNLWLKPSFLSYVWATLVYNRLFMNIQYFY